MIVGVRIRIPSADLQQHVKGRHQHHSDRANNYAAQIEALKGLGENKGVTNDPITTLKKDRDEHQQKAAFFGILDQYLVLNETYELDSNDLGRLEFVSRWF